MLQIFFFILHLLDLLKLLVQEICINFIIFGGFPGTSGVTKQAVSRTRKIFIQCNSYHIIIALEVGFHLIGHMYLILVGGVIRPNHDL